jgi:hypothetical protein
MPALLLPIALVAYVVGSGQVPLLKGGKDT